MPSLRAKNQGEAGLTFVELLAGLAMVMSILGGVLLISLRVSNMRKQDEQIALALLACQNNLEEARGMPFGSLSSLHGVGFDVPDMTGKPGGLKPLPGDSDGLAGRFTVVVDRSASGTKLYRVTAAVDWLGASDPRQLKLVTLIGDRSQP